MNTDFDIKIGTTVDKNFNWDDGNPYITTSLLQSASLSLNEKTIVGYAPYLNVSLSSINTSISSTATNYAFILNFGDYYNDETNIVVRTCPNSIPFVVEHLYILPGLYTVTLTQINGFTGQISASEVVSKTNVLVRENLPQALIYNLTQPLTGTSPHTVHLTPRYSTPGSFPIDRIDWDFNDGTPPITVTRYSTPNSNIFVNNRVFYKDLQDPRNFDAIRTYTRNNETGSVFYPSITCYSSSTNSYDSCSTIVGPISLSRTPSQMNLIKVRNYPAGNLYCVDVNNNLAILTDNQTFIDDPQDNVPENKLRNEINTIAKYGNNIFYYPSVIPGTESTLETKFITVTSSVSTFFIDGFLLSSTTCESENFIVNVGGVIQQPSKYTITPLTTSSGTITFTDPVTSNFSILKLFTDSRLNTYTLSGWYSEITSKTSTKTLLLSNYQLIQDSNRYIVTVDGILQSPDKYSVSLAASSITFDAPVLSGLPIVVQPLPYTIPTTTTITVPLCGISETVSRASSWNFATGSDPSVYYSFTGNSALTNRSAGYLVTIGGVLQDPSDYTIDTLNRILILRTVPPSNTTITVLQPNNVNYTKSVLRLYQRSC